LLPVSYIGLFVGTCALLAFPSTSGFYTKDVIIEMAMVELGISEFLETILTLFSAVLTLAYSYKLCELVFFREPAGPRVRYLQVKDAPGLMVIPLCILSFCSLFVGFLVNDLFLGGSHLFLECNYTWNYISSRDYMNMELVGDLESFFVIFLVCFVTVIFVLHGIEKSGFGSKLSLYWKHSSAEKMYLGSAKGFFDVWINVFLLKKTFLKGCHTVVVFIDRGLLEFFGPTGLVLFGKHWNKIVSYLQTGFIFHYFFLFFLGVLFLSFNIFAIKLFVGLNKFYYLFAIAYFVGLYLQELSGSKVEGLPERETKQWFGLMWGLVLIIWYIFNGVYTCVFSVWELLLFFVKYTYCDIFLHLVDYWDLCWILYINPCLLAVMDFENEYWALVYWSCWFFSLLVRCWLFVGVTFFDTILSSIFYFLFFIVAICLFCVAELFLFSVSCFFVFKQWVTTIYFLSGLGMSYYTPDYWWIYVTYGMSQVYLVYAATYKFWLYKMRMFFWNLLVFVVLFIFTLIMSCIYYFFYPFRWILWHTLCYVQVRDTTGILAYGIVFVKFFGHCFDLVCVFCVIYAEHAVRGLKRLKQYYSESWSTEWEKFSKRFDDMHTFEWSDFGIVFRFFGVEGFYREYFFNSLCFGMVYFYVVYVLVIFYIIRILFPFLQREFELYLICKQSILEECDVDDILGVGCRSLIHSEQSKYPVFNLYGEVAFLLYSRITKYYSKGVVLVEQLESRLLFRKYLMESWRRYISEDMQVPMYFSFIRLEEVEVESDVYEEIGFSMSVREYLKVKFAISKFFLDFFYLVCEFFFLDKLLIYARKDLRRGVLFLGAILYIVLNPQLGDVLDPKPQIVTYKNEVQFVRFDRKPFFVVRWFRKLRLYFWEDRLKKLEEVLSELLPAFDFTLDLIWSFYEPVISKRYRWVRNLFWRTLFFTVAKACNDYLRKYRNIYKNRKYALGAVLNPKKAFLTDNKFSRYPRSRITLTLLRSLIFRVPEFTYNKAKRIVWLYYRRSNVYRLYFFYVRCCYLVSSLYQDALQCVMWFFYGPQNEKYLEYRDVNVKRKEKSLLQKRQFYPQIVLNLAIPVILEEKNKCLTYADWINFLLKYNFIKADKIYTVRFFFVSYYVFYVEHKIKRLKHILHEAYRLCIAKVNFFTYVLQIVGVFLRIVFMEMIMYPVYFITHNLLFFPRILRVCYIIILNLVLGHIELMQCVSVFLFGKRYKRKFLRFYLRIKFKYVWLLNVVTGIPKENLKLRLKVFSMILKDLKARWKIGVRYAEFCAEQRKLDAFDIRVLYFLYRFALYRIVLLLWDRRFRYKIMVVKLGPKEKYVLRRDCFLDSFVEEDLMFYREEREENYPFKRQLERNSAYIMGKDLKMGDGRHFQYCSPFYLNTMLWTKSEIINYPGAFAYLWDTKKSDFGFFAGLAYLDEPYFSYKLSLVPEPFYGDIGWDRKKRRKKIGWTNKTMWDCNRGSPPIFPDIDRALNLLRRESGFPLPTDLDADDDNQDPFESPIPESEEEDWYYFRSRFFKFARAIERSISLNTNQDYTLVGDLSEIIDVCDEMRQYKRFRCLDPYSDRTAVYQHSKRRAVSFLVKLPKEMHQYATVSNSSFTEKFVRTRTSNLFLLYPSSGLDSHLEDAEIDDYFIESSFNPAYVKPYMQECYNLTEASSWSITHPEFFADPAYMACDRYQLGHEKGLISFFFRMDNGHDAAMRVEDKYSLSNYYWLGNRMTRNKLVTKVFVVINGVVVSAEKTLSRLFVFKCPVRVQPYRKPKVFKGEIREPIFPCIGTPWIYEECLLPISQQLEQQIFDQNLVHDKSEEVVETEFYWWNNILLIELKTDKQEEYKEDNFLLSIGDENSEYFASVDVKASGEEDLLDFLSREEIEEYISFDEEYCSYTLEAIYRGKLDILAVDSGCLHDISEVQKEIQTALVREKRAKRYLTIMENSLHTSKKSHVFCDNKFKVFKEMVRPTKEDDLFLEVLKEYEVFQQNYVENDIELCTMNENETAKYLDWCQEQAIGPEYTLKEREEEDFVDAMVSAKALLEWLDSEYKPAPSFYKDPNRKFKKTKAYKFMNFLTKVKARYLAAFEADKELLAAVERFHDEPLDYLYRDSAEDRPSKLDWHNYLKEQDLPFPEGFLKKKKKKREKALCEPKMRMSDRDKDGFIDFKLKELSDATLKEEFMFNSFTYDKVAEATNLEKDGTVPNHLHMAKIRLLPAYERLLYNDIIANNGNYYIVADYFRYYSGMFDFFLRNLIVLPCVWWYYTMGYAMFMSGAVYNFLQGMAFFVSKPQVFFAAFFSTKPTVYVPGDPGLGFRKLFLLEEWAVRYKWVYKPYLYYWDKYWTKFDMDMCWFLSRFDFRTPWKTYRAYRRWRRRWKRAKKMWLQEDVYLNGDTVKWSSSDWFAYGIPVLVTCALFVIFHLHCLALASRAARDAFRNFYPYAWLLIGCLVFYALYPFMYYMYYYEGINTMFDSYCVNNTVWQPYYYNKFVDHSNTIRLGPNGGFVDYLVNPSSIADDVFLCYPHDIPWFGTEEMYPDHEESLGFPVQTEMFRIIENFAVGWMTDCALLYDLFWINLWNVWYFCRYFGFFALLNWHHCGYFFSVATNVVPWDAAFFGLNPGKLSWFQHAFAVMPRTVEDLDRMVLSGTFFAKVFCYFMYLVHTFSIEIVYSVYRTYVLGTLKDLSVFGAVCLFFIKCISVNIQAIYVVLKFVCPYIVYVFLGILGIQLLAISVVLVPFCMFLTIVCKFVYIVLGLVFGLIQKMFFFVIVRGFVYGFKGFKYWFINLVSVYDVKVDVFIENYIRRYLYNFVLNSLDLKVQFGYMRRRFVSEWFRNLHFLEEERWWEVTWTFVLLPVCTYVLLLVGLLLFLDEILFRQSILRFLLRLYRRLSSFM